MRASEDGGDGDDKGDGEDGGKDDDKDKGKLGCTASSPPSFSSSLSSLHLYPPSADSPTG